VLQRGPRSRSQFYKDSETW